MPDQSRIRELLLEQMSERNAHVDFPKAVEGLSLEETGLKPKGFDHSIWELIEHIRIAQYDILEFSRNQIISPRPGPMDTGPKSISLLI